MARGIYQGTSAFEDDYALYRDHRGRWRADRVGRGGTHTTLGRTTGEDSKTAAARLAESDAQRRGTYSAAVFLVNEDGSLTQIANVVYGRYRASGRDRPRSRARRDESGNWLVRSGRLRVGQIRRSSPVSFMWQSFRGSHDGGVSDSREDALKRILHSAGMSPRQYEISLEPTDRPFRWEH